MREVTLGFECGIALDGYNDIHEPLQATLVAVVTRGVGWNEEPGCTDRIRAANDRHRCRVILHGALSPFAEAKTL